MSTPRASLRYKVDGWLSDAQAEVTRGRERPYWEGRVTALRDVLTLLDAEPEQEAPPTFTMRVTERANLPATSDTTLGTSSGYAEPEQGWQEPWPECPFGKAQAVIAKAAAPPRPSSPAAEEK